MKKCLTMLLLVVFAIGAVFAQGAVETIPVKVLVLNMFEVGEYSGDFAGEFQHWYEQYLDGAQSYDVQGFPNPLFVNDSGVAGAVTGMGKAEAASSLTAILSDNRFDFSETYIIVSGCSGTPPARGTLGDVIWATELVDYELGHGWVESDTPVGIKGTFLKDDSYAEAGYIMLNKTLVDWAFDITKDIELADDPKAAAYRALYGPEAAAKTPSVRTGVSVTADCYWHGPNSSLRADEVTKAYGAGTYMVTQMEDNSFGVVARRFGLLDRLLVCRDVVNFDQPHDGQTVLESLNASSGAFSIGMLNGFRVGSAVVDELIGNWEVYADRIPGNME